MPRRPTISRADGYDEPPIRSDSYDADLGLDEVELPAEFPEFDAALNLDLDVDDTAVPVSMTDDEILAAVTQELNVAQGGDDSDVSENRIRALEWYNGEMTAAPPGRSQAVSTDVADVIEWTLPQVISALCDSGSVVSFDAVGEDDENAAQLETDAVYHVLTKENEGFLYVYSVVKDALLQKNGIGKVYWDETTEVVHENYTGLTQQEVLQLLEPQDGSIVGPIAYSEQTSETITMLPPRRAHSSRACYPPRNHSHWSRMTSK